MKPGSKIRIGKMQEVGNQLPETLKQKYTVKEVKDYNKAHLIAILYRYCEYLCKHKEIIKEIILPG